MRQGAPALRDWGHDDIVQECYVRTLSQLDSYSGHSKLSTWALSVARNHLVSQARSISARPKVNLVDVECASGVWGSAEPAHEPDPGRRVVLRSHTKELLGWLRSTPDGIEQGWAVLNLLLKTHGNWNYTANALCIHTGRPWTTERVRRVVRAIKDTPQGMALCNALGIGTTANEEESIKGDE